MERVKCSNCGETVEEWEAIGYCTGRRTLYMCRACAGKGLADAERRAYWKAVKNHDKRMNEGKSWKR